MSERDEVKKCSICGKEYTGWGNNAWPVNDGRCCDDCNDRHVIPARLAAMSRNRKSDDQKKSS